MKLKRKLASFVVAGIMAVMSCSSLASSAYNYDANGNGEVNISDAVLIMQTLSNPDEYQLTPQGIANADIDGDGVTAMDALKIQEMILNI